MKSNMRLLLFSGFLGSGKTTLVIELVREIVARGQRAAILVNEIGEIGIDNQLMRRLDLNVWELLNGCICCTLSADLVATLEKLDHEYQPDLVIVEPSGAADPRSILKALPYYRGTPFEAQRTVAVVDPLRLEILLEVLTPLITSQIQRADLILISKIDLASQQEIDYAKQKGRELNPEAEIVLSDGQSLAPDILAAITPWLN